MFSHPLTVNFYLFGRNDYSTSYTGTNNVGWNIAGKLKAKNAFGTPSEHSYRVQLLGAEQRYKIVSVSIDGEVVVSTVVDKTPAVEDTANVGISKKEAAAIRRESEFRTWTSTASTTIEARFAGKLGKTVTLEKRDGKKIELPLEKLSDEDQAFIAEKQKR